MGRTGLKVVDLDDTFMTATVIREDGKIGTLEASMLLPE